MYMTLAGGCSVHFAMAGFAASMGFGGFWAKMPRTAEQHKPLSSAAVAEGQHLQEIVFALVEKSVIVQENTCEVQHVLIPTLADDAAPVSVGVHVPESPPLFPYSVSCMELLQRAVVKSLGPDGSATAWLIIASLPLDCLLLLLFSGRCRCMRSKPCRRAEVAGDHCIVKASGDATEVVDQAVQDLREAMEQCVEDAPDPENAPGLTLTPPKIAKRRDASELKIWMEKQRDQCEIVENTQALVVTDAKHGGDLLLVDASQDREDFRYPEAPPPENAPRSQRAKLRSDSEVQVWMNKKRLAADM